MKHGGIPIEFVCQRELCETRAAIERAPVRQGWQTVPAVLRGEGGHIHPVTRRHFAIFTTLLIDFRVKVVACGEIPWQVMERDSLRAILSLRTEV